MDDEPPCVSDKVTVLLMLRRPCFVSLWDSEAVLVYSSEDVPVRVEDRECSNVPVDVSVRVICRLRERLSVPVAVLVIVLVRNGDSVSPV
jgi:hypothetical protein